MLSSLSSPLEDICLEIVKTHRRRVFAMEQRKRADLALRSYLRVSLGWRKDLPKVERDAIAAQAAAMVVFGEEMLRTKPKRKPTPKPAGFDAFIEVIIAAISSRAPFLKLEEIAEKEMERLAAQLPVWDGFGRDIKGFGLVSLAVLVGDTTSDWAPTLGEYKTKGGLWKRLGIATVDGIRQGGLRKSATAEEWVAHGYSAARRARIWVIGDVLIKNQNAYREIYLARKAVERARAEAAGLIVAPAAKIPRKGADKYMADGHVHRRAQRFMEQRFTADLWRAWRRLHRVHARPDQLFRSPVAETCFTSPARVKPSAVSA